MLCDDDETKTSIAKRYLAHVQLNLWSIQNLYSPECEMSSAHCLLHLWQRFCNILNNAHEEVRSKFPTGSQTQDKYAGNPTVRF